MNKKKSILVIIVIVLGIYFGTSYQQTKDSEDLSVAKKTDVRSSGDSNLKMSDQVVNAKDRDMNTKLKHNIVFKSPYYKNNPYLGNLLKDPNFIEVYERSESLFKEYSFSEDLAVWLSIGVVFDSSPEYGELFETSISKLNNQKNEVYDAISNEITSIGPEDSFVRQQLINVVGGMDITRDKKVSFFGSEASRKVVLDENGDFTPDSMNITNSIAFLKQSGTTVDEARRIFEQSISTNTSPEIREKLRARFNTYFPESANL